MGDTEILQFTRAQLWEWLVHDTPVRGLSEAVIDAQRAWAFVHNPYVNDNDVMVTAIYEDDQLAAFAACFPDQVADKRSWWFSTLYCRAESRGKGYGIIALGSLCEAHEDEDFYDMDGAPETVESLNFLGMKGTTIPRYRFCDKSIRTNSLKGFLAYLADTPERRSHSHNKQKLMHDIAQAQYRVRYVSHIDSTTYDFIRQHAQHNTLLRQQQMLNWILEYPFCMQSPSIDRVKERNPFGSATTGYQLQAVQVWDGNTLIGFYVYRYLDSEFSVKYLYYDPAHQQEVFLSIAEHYLLTRCTSIKVVDPALADWLKQRQLTSKCVVEQQSFSYPQHFDLSPDLGFQGGDGDTFV